MSSRSSVVMNGRTYTRSGLNWVDETGTFVPTFLLPALNAAITANAAPPTKAPLKKSRATAKRG